MTNEGWLRRQMRELLRLKGFEESVEANFVAAPNA